jgi:energy-coupling factor transporter ATP-binding protein EcfA2
MLTALVQLRSALQGADLPLEMPGAEEQRGARAEMVDQLEDYVIPRLMTIDAPLLAVVGGSTGAGKSTLVNSLVGRRVTEPGVLRPTTRSPVLVHHPDDAHWFGQDRLLPDLERVQRQTNDPGALQLVASDTMPAGLAVLDAPDIDSVEERNRTLAAQLLAAADLWLFVTSAARYADQVPWGFLRQAADRSTAVAIVLDRTPEDAIQTVSTHLARMLASRGLKDSPLFTVTEGRVDDDGLLAHEAVADIRGWLVSLAEDADARAAVVKQTLEGAVRTLTRRSHDVADAAAEQVAAVARLREDVDRSYAAAVTAITQASPDGTLPQREVLAGREEYVGAGELLASLEDRDG